MEIALAPAAAAAVAAGLGVELRLFAPTTTDFGGRRLFIREEGRLYGRRCC